MHQISRASGQLGLLPPSWVKDVVVIAPDLSIVVEGMVANRNGGLAKVSERFWSMFIQDGTHTLWDMPACNYYTFGWHYPARQRHGEDRCDPEVLPNALPQICQRGFYIGHRVCGPLGRQRR